MTLTNQSITLEPSDVELVGSAYDEVWAGLAIEFGEADSPVVEHARMQLARIMLELVTLHQLDGQELKSTALRVFKESANSVGA